MGAEEMVLTTTLLGSLRRHFLCLVLLLCPGLLIAAEPSPGEAQAAPTARTQLLQLFEREWQFRLQEFPQLASWVGMASGAADLNRAALEDQLRRQGFWQNMLVELRQVNLADLSAEDQVNAEMFRRQLQSFVDDIEYHAYLIPFTSDEGFHTELARLPQTSRFRLLSDYENYLSRIGQIDRVFGEYQALLQQGLKEGMSLPQVVLAGRDRAFSAHVVDQVEDSIYYQPFAGSVPQGISLEQWRKLQAQAKQLIDEEIIPAYRDFTRFFLEQYVPQSRTSLAARELPRGADYYRNRVAYYTTLEISPEQVHQLGLQEVARIEAEMKQIIADLKFDGSFKDFLQFLRSDPQFYAQSPEALLKHAAWIAKRADAALPALFNTLPRQPYGVAPVPDDIAPHYTGGRYVPAPVDGTEPGYYWVNTYQLTSRPLYVLPALTLHEAVPGHHLQIALAAEQGEQPEFRRNDYISAYGEGWGLYAEYLGIEMGIYRTPYENFGRLTYEMWRACRLVVDTGIHWYGWSRQQAVDYLAGHTALSLHEVNTEVDRYISWPGQALSYKMGELKIKALRKEAEQALGEAFDIREFHDNILALGSVPLPILEQQVRQYIQEHTKHEHGSD